MNSVSADGPAEETGSSLKSDGCVIIRELITSGQVNAFSAELQPYLSAAEHCSDEFLGSRTQRIGGLIAQSSTFDSFVLDPLILSICDTILKPSCSSYHVGITQAINVGPASASQPLHREDLLYPVPHPHPDFIVATMWAMDDFTEENGATRIVPGSHLWPEDRVALDNETVAAEMPKGSVLLWLGATWHGAGANRSTPSRMGAYLRYSLGWLRQEEN